MKFTHRFLSWFTHDFLVTLSFTLNIHGLFSQFKIEFVQRFSFKFSEKIVLKLIFLLFTFCKKFLMNVRNRRNLYFFLSNNLLGYAKKEFAAHKRLEQLLLSAYCKFDFFYLNESKDVYCENSIKICQILKANAKTNFFM